MLMKRNEFIDSGRAFEKKKKKDRKNIRYIVDFKHTARTELRKLALSTFDITFVLLFCKHA